MNRLAVFVAYVLLEFIFFSHAVTKMILKSRGNFHHSVSNTIWERCHGCTIAPSSKPVLKRSRMAQHGEKSEMIYVGSFFVASISGGILKLISEFCLCLLVQCILVNKRRCGGVKNTNCFPANEALSLAYSKVAFYVFICYALSILTEIRV